MDGNYLIFAKACLRRALIASFTSGLAWLCVWAGPPVQFAPPVNSAIGDPARDSIAIAAADFDGDGTIDLAAGSRMLNDLEILTGAGDGTFQEKTNYFVLGHSLRISVADFNHDNKPDLAFGGSAFLGTGDGGFVSVNIFTNSDTQYGWILGAGDFTGDGNADLVCVQPGTQIDPQNGDALTVWAGDGSGGFKALTNSYNLGFQSTDPFDCVSGDLDGDGALDLVVYYTVPGLPNSLNVLLATRDGSFLMVTNYTLGLAPVGGTMELGDFNGDAKPDLAAITGTSDLILFLGDGTGAFQNLTNYDLHLIGGAVAIGDVNGDGHADVVAATGAGSITVFTGNGDGSFSSAFEQQPNLNFYSDVQLADVNGDGRPDILVCYSGVVSVLLNKTVPALGIKLAGDQITLDWPAWKGFVLESAEDLSAPTIGLR